MALISRRELMKQGLKGTAYVAPAVLTMAPAAVSAQVSGSRCTLRLDAPASSSIGFAKVRWIGTGFTPNGTIQFLQASGFFAHCRGIIIIPGTTRTADALGNFDLILPPTAFSFSVVLKAEQVNPGFVTLGVADSTCGLQLIDYPVLEPGPGPEDSLTLLYVSNPASSALGPPAVPLPGESGSGTVIAGQCFTFAVVEIRLTLSGAMPNRTYTLFLTVPSFAPIAEGTMTTNGAGSATLARYLPNCAPALLGGSSTLSLTVDGNPPGPGNVAYQTTLVRNFVPVC